MKIIIGLGNYGKTYENTRHNVGFEIVDRLAKKHSISISKFEHKSLVGSGFINGQKVLLVKPQTFMNLSGIAVSSILSYYNLDLSDIIVIYDDISLSLGKIRIRKKGSSGGHNGIKDIIERVGSDVFPRLKFGVDARPPHFDLADWVLSHFSKEETKLLEEKYELAATAVSEMIADVELAANKFN